MPVTFYEPISLAEAVLFLEDCAGRAASQHDGLTFGALTSALAILTPALRIQINAQEDLAMQSDYEARVEQVREAAGELGFGLHCACPNCEAAREGREDPPCDCPECRALRAEEGEEEDPA